MIRENIHASHENRWATSARRKMLIGQWAQRRLSLLALVGILVLVISASLASVPLAAQAASSVQLTSAGDWTTYGYNNARTNFNPAETAITPSTAPSLKQKWAHSANNGVSDQAVTMNGIVYWGSWDGYAHATNISTNAYIWSKFIGRTTDSSCIPPQVGVASTPTVATVNGQLEVFVGGGDANLYALNASSGNIIWHTSLGSSPSHFIWDSPALYNGSIYIGISSFGDCPLVQGKMFQLNASTGAVQHTFNVVPNGCTGGGVWGSPTIDESAGHVFFVTGNSGNCSSSQNDHSFALVELNLDLSVASIYQLPANQRPGDSDFGSTPTLFTNSSGSMVGVANKNGKYYAFHRSNIATGPAWTKQVANGGDCPQCANGSISPSAWDGTNLYVGGGSTTIAGQSCKGGVRKLNPDNGSYIWEHCMQSGGVLGSVTATSSGIVAASQGTTVIVMNASTGATLARLTDNKSGSLLYAGPTISNGILLVGNLDGNLYAYSINGT
jgi:polyvinyl alcohol dehydrogenase (cytochrome)